MKNVLRIFLCFMLLFTSTSTINASHIKNELVHNDSNDTRYVPCPGGGRHQMASYGLGVLYSGASQSNPGKYLFRGPITQCRGCDIFMISEYYASAASIYTGPGRYRIVSSLLVLDGAYAVYGGVDGSCYSNMLNDPIMGSFQFVLAYNKMN